MGVGETSAVACLTVKLFVVMCHTPVRQTASWSGQQQTRPAERGAAQTECPPSGLGAHLKPL